MENTTIYLSDLICNCLNSIFLKFFSFFDATIYSNLDNLLLIRPTIVDNLKFQKLFGTDASNGFLLIAHSLIFGIILFYVLHLVISHLIYSKIDSPYQFIFKCIIFITCMNCSLWICKQIIYLVSLISESICQIGYFNYGIETNFSNLIDSINSALCLSSETFEIFSLDGIIKLLTTFCIFYILLTFCMRYLFCKILILLSPFAFISLICNRFDGFFKSWFKQFLILLSMQIFVFIVLVLGFSLEFYANDALSKLIYCAIIMILAKSHFHTKEFFSQMHNYSRNSLKNFI